MRRVILLLAILALALPAMGSTPESNNALASGDASATVTLAGAAQSLFFANDGANAVFVRAWSGCETPAAITAATSGALKVMPGEKVTFPPIEKCGLGIIAFSHIGPGGGLTTTSRWYAQ